MAEKYGEDPSEVLTKFGQLNCNKNDLEEWL